MIIKVNTLILLLIILILSGCVTTPEHVWTSNPPSRSVSNDFFEARLKPICISRGCRLFLLTIKNKTDKNLEIDWNKTLYITHGQTSGGFMFEGIIFRDRNNPKSPDIVFANSTFIKSIYPNNLVYSKEGKSGAWRHDYMMIGENGVYLVVLVDGKEVREKLTVRLFPTQTQNK